MTQAFNLSQLANFVNSSGQLDGSTGVVNAVPSSTSTTNIAGGTKGQVPVQSAAGTTTFIDSSFALKNRILNGQMVIDQRNAGASVTPSANQYLVDRWQAATNVSSKFSVQQSTTAPTGFNYSMLVTSLSAYTIGASELCAVRQSIEGYNIADLGLGTASAKTFTVSFWVRSSLTGTFGGSLMNGGADYSYPFTYTISAANTWEQKSVTVAGATAGTWLTTNGIGLSILFGLGVGSTFSGTAGSWSANGYYGATGATSVVGTNGATFYITGVQLEKGSTATSFDYRPYGTELALCQRYYEQYKDQIANSYVSVRTGSYYGYITWQVPKRTAPTIGNYTSFNFAGFVGDINTVTSAVFDNQQVNNTRFYANSVGPFTAQSAYVYVNGTLSISAEL